MATVGADQTTAKRGVKLATSKSKKKAVGKKAVGKKKTGKAK
jgi:hypothetical protein